MSCNFALNSIIVQRICEKGTSAVLRVCDIQIRKGSARIHSSKLNFLSSKSKVSFDLYLFALILNLMEIQNLRLPSYIPL